MQEERTTVLSLGEMISYGIAGLGQNMIYALTSTFLMFFYTDVFGINAAAAGTLMLIARFWDAIVDPIAGTIVDRTRTRWGKLRPYLLFSPVPLAVFTILTFSAPQMNDSMKLLYAYVTYIVWGTIYSFNDVPYWGLSAALTADTQKRTSLISLTRVLTMVGFALAMIGIPYAAGWIGSIGRESALAEGITPALKQAIDQQGYFWTAVIISIIATILILVAFFGTKERARQDRQKTTLRDNLKIVGKNKPLLLLLLSGLLGTTRMLAQVSGMYFAKYNLGDETMFSLLGAFVMGGTIAAIILTPLLTKKFSKKSIYIVSSIIGGIVYLAFYFVGYTNQVLDFIAYVVVGLTFGFFMVLQSAMIGDSVDYADWKTGKRAEGICFAGQTFITKLTAALSSFIVGWVLAFAGFQANSIAGKPVLDGIFFTITLLPAAGCFLSVIPMFFYKFTEKEQKKAIAEINARGTGAVK